MYTDVQIGTLGMAACFLPVEGIFIERLAHLG